MAGVNTFPIINNGEKTMPRGVYNRKKAKAGVKAEPKQANELYIVGAVDALSEFKDFQSGKTKFDDLSIGFSSDGPMGTVKQAVKSCRDDYDDNETLVVFKLVPILHNENEQTDVMFGFQKF
jgi:hypothetical protein